ncbi:VPLPA-CTERM sorting domain-containing protein [bacterium]|nr:VPLPA-CTERM sorting domain-containing protein [bacterium]
MKKIFLAIYLLLIFSTTTANAYTAFVGIDDSFDLTSVVGFYFEVSVPSDSLDLTIYYQQGDTDVVCGKDIGGAVPPNIFAPWPIQLPWRIGPLSTSPNGYLGIDLTFGSFNLIPGIILSLEAEDAFILDNFILAGMNPDGVFFYDLYIIEPSCIEGDIYALSAVPIPGSLVLLGSGLIGLIGLGRRRMRK